MTRTRSRLFLAIVTVSTLGTWALADDLNIQPLLPTKPDPVVQSSFYGDKTVWSYSGKDAPLPWALFHPNDFSSIPAKFDGAGVTDMGQVPAPGVHPRIFFSPEDLPRLRERLKTSRAAQEAWKNVLAYSNSLRLTYDEKADYAKPDWMGGSFGVHGRAQLFRIGGYNLKREDYYTGLADGEAPTRDYEFMDVAGIEALRCLIENDADGAHKLAKATVTAIRLEQDRCLLQDKPVKPGQPPNISTNRLWAEGLAFVYDFIYNWMDDSQRKICHDELVEVSAWHDNYGTFNAADTSRSNFASFSYWVYDLLAIEGEPGFNDLKYRGLYRSWRNFMTTSYFESGSIFEGEGKSLLGTDALAAFDRLAVKYQQDPLTHHATIPNHFGNFTISSILPTQDAFVLFDYNGGMGRPVCTPIDVVVAKYLYPNDKRIDFIYHVIVGDDYHGLPSRCDSLQNQVVISALFASDFDPTNTPEKLGLGNTFFCGQRAMMLTRSSWDKDATFLTMHVRGASGGHPFHDRNGLMLAGKGRPWVTIPVHSGTQFGDVCSTVLFDGCDQSGTTPGRVVDLVDNPQATFLVGDAKYCWDWVWKTMDKTNDGKFIMKDDVTNNNITMPGGGWSPLNQSFNDFAWTKQNAEAYNRPLKFNESWYLPAGILSPYVREVNTPVLKDFRTAGIVRGTHPYVLVVDDIQRNAMPARYDWNLTLCDDVVLAKNTIPGALPQDVIFAGGKSVDATGALQTGEPGLLVRVLQMKGKALPPTLMKKHEANVFTQSTVTLSPDFKVMLFPFKMGEPLPVTTWEGGPTNLSITFPDQSDQLTFSVADSGKTDVRIARAGQELVNVNHPIAPFIDPATDELDQEVRKLSAEMATLAQFNPDTLEGLVGSWPMNKLVGNTFPADQPALPAITGDMPVVANENFHAGARFGKDGGHLQYDFKAAAPSACTFAFSVLGNAQSTCGLFDLSGSRGLSFDMVQGSMRCNAVGNWGYGSGQSAEMLGDWTHLAATWDGKTVVMYRDGRPLITIPSDKPPLLEKKLGLGGGGFAGLIRNLRFYNVALSPEQIKQMYLWDYYKDRALP